jgi:hypothetical protein
LRVLLQRLDIRGRVKALHGQNRRTEEPPLALFAVCTPFGPPSLLEVPQKEVMFKSKHKLDLAHVSMDQRYINEYRDLLITRIALLHDTHYLLSRVFYRGKLLLGYSDAELANMGGYHLVHFDDLAYVASAHQECEYFFFVSTHYLINNISLIYRYTLLLFMIIYCFNMSKCISTINFFRTIHFSVYLCTFYNLLNTFITQIKTLSLPKSMFFLKKKLNSSVKFRYVRCIN